MKTKDDIIDLIHNGENSFVEFKTEKVDNAKLAKEMVAFANARGGTLLIGVEDNGQIEGISAPQLEQRIMNIASSSIYPAIIPLYYELLIDAAKKIAVVEIEQGINKPYCYNREGKTHYYIRFGSESRIATREQLQRLFQAAGGIHFELKPVFGATITDLDLDLVENFCFYHRHLDLNSLTKDEQINFLTNMQLLILEENKICATVAGLLMFGRDPKRFLYQAGISVVRYKGIEKSYDYVKREIRKPAISKQDKNTLKIIVEGSIDDAVRFVSEQIPQKAGLQGARREVQYAYPLESVREAIVNAVAHRDYTIAGADISVDIFDDRLEIKSPGKIPNTLTIEKMKIGTKYYRNQLLVDYLAEAGYMDKNSLGIPLKILKLSRDYTGKEPLLEEQGEELRVVLYPREDV
jgi:ATP-dependent DNA helicase RecG